ncbi:MAG TPA: SUMF1/EgtB/PvdO family nonheme iron enzyme [Clostridiales bacterium]|nr:SUMF1/EgtB/PvdO family nonheme iron enzyme [Clostridiales bacterium]
MPTGLMILITILFLSAFLFFIRVPEKKYLFLVIANVLSIFNWFLMAALTNAKGEGAMGAFILVFTVPVFYLVIIILLIISVIRREKPFWAYLMPFLAIPAAIIYDNAVGGYYFSVAGFLAFFISIVVDFLKCHKEIFVFGNLLKLILIRIYTYIKKHVKEIVISLTVLISAVLITTYSFKYIDNRLEESIISKISEDMIFVKGGSFDMGDHFTESYGNEKPVHQVLVSDFYVNKYEVSQSQYQLITGSNPSRFIGKNNPVENVSWSNAVMFCNKLSEIEQLQKCYRGTGDSIICDFKANGYRLPTEAEWEYAARGGIHNTDDFRYSGCHKVTDLDEYAWFYDNNKPVGTKQIGFKLPNQLGIYDMTGNVWEWCWDYLNNEYYKYCVENNITENPTGPDMGYSHVLRGGCWGCSDENCIVTIRFYSDGGGTIGFRVVRSADN